MNDDFLHVAGAFVNLAHAHIAVNSFHRKVADHTVAAQSLNGRAANFLCGFAGKQLGHGRFFQTRQARISQSGRVPHQLTRGFQLRGAFGQAKAHGLVVDDGRAKTLALLGVVNGHFQGAARHANALRSNANAATFERRQGNLVTFAFLPDQVFNRYFAVFKIDLRGVA